MKNDQFKSGRGGKRQGSGRPSETKSGIAKKPVKIRLDPDVIERCNEMGGLTHCIEMGLDILLSGKLNQQAKKIEELGRRIQEIKSGQDKSETNINTDVKILADLIREKSKCKPPMLMISEILNFSHFAPEKLAEIVNKGIEKSVFFTQSHAHPAQGVEGKNMLRNPGGNFYCSVQLRVR